MARDGQTAHAASRMRAAHKVTGCHDQGALRILHSFYGFYDRALPCRYYLGSDMILPEASKIVSAYDELAGRLAAWPQYTYTRYRRSTDAS
jgi:hypothetical protein